MREVSCVALDRVLHYIRRTIDYALVYDFDIEYRVSVSKKSVKKINAGR